MGKLNGAEGARQKREILDALKKLGEVITTDEDLYLQQLVDGDSGHFARMNDASRIENASPELHAILCAALCSRCSCRCPVSSCCQANRECSKSSMSTGVNMTLVRNLKAIIQALFRSDSFDV